MKPLKASFTVGALLAIAPIVLLGMFSATLPLASACWFAGLVVLAGAVVDNFVLRKELDTKLGRLSVIRRVLESLLRGEDNEGTNEEDDD